MITSPELTYPLILRGAALAVTFLAAGFLLAYGEAHLQPPFPALPYQATWVKGIVTQSEFLPPRVEGVHAPGKWRITLKNVVFDSPFNERLAPLGRTLRVTLKPHDGLRVPLGEEVKLKALLKKTPPPIYPGGMDFQRISWFSGRAGGGRALSDIKAETGSQKPTFLSPRWTGRWIGRLIGQWTALREHIAGRISTVLSGQNGAFVMTVLCGETSSLSAQTRQDFAASGLAHLLAVAGLHLGLVMTFCVFTIRALLVRSSWLALYWPCRTIAYISALVIGGFYVALTGFHLPGLRALGMACLVVLAIVAGRQALSLRSLALVALALEITSPSRIFDISFQMSFMAVMALIVGYEALRASLSDLSQRSWMWGKIGLPLIFLALTSLLAGIAVLPVSTAHFGAFQPWFVIANMVAVPLMGFWIMPLGLVSLAVMPLGWESIPLGMMGWGVDVVRQCASFMAHVPLASVPVPLVPSWGLTLILLGLCLFCLWRGKARFAGLILLFGGMISPWIMEKPVLIISSDGKELLFHDRHHLYAKLRKKQNFIIDSWQKAFALPIEPLPESCLKGACLLSYKGQNLWVMGPAYKDLGKALQDHPACSQISLVVNLSKMGNPCPSATSLGRYAVWREGSWAVYSTLKGGWRLVSDKQVRGQRLWVMEPDQEGDPGLPLAHSE